MMKWSRSQMVGGKLSHLYIILILINLFYLGSVSCKTSNDTCASFETDGKTIPSGDIILPEGSDLTIVCKLKEGSNVSSADLVYYHDEHLLPSEMVEIINSSAIRLHVKNVTASQTNYYCHNKVTDKGVCYNIVAVDTEPRVVEDYKCYSNNWESLQCEWRAPKQYVKTDYQIAFTLKGRSARYEYKCPQKNMLKDALTNTYECVWNLSTDPLYRRAYETYTFIITGENIFGKTNKTFVFNHYASVKPKPIEGLEVLNTTSSSALLSWNPNVKMSQIPTTIMYQFKVQSSFDNADDWEVKDVQQSTLKNISYGSQGHVKYIYPLTHLNHSYTIYDVQVRYRTSNARQEQFWSETARTSFRTKSALPSAAPRTDVGSFEINYQYRHIYVYWQQIQNCQQNGPNFTYTVVVRAHNVVQSIRPVELEASYAKFTGLDFSGYEFQIFSTNVVGNSTNSSVVRVPGSQHVIAEPSSVTKIDYGKYTFELSWIPPVTKARVSSYTLFWCKDLKDRPYQCTGFLNWTQVSGDTMAKNVTVGDGIYQFAISANTEHGSSGMVWASCTVILNKVHGKMRNIYAVAKGPNAIEVNFTLDCSGRIGIVTGYRVYYCPVLNKDAPACLQPEMNVTLPGDLSPFSGLLTNLKAFTMYSINVSVITRTTEGPKSDPQFVTTDETAPDAPRHVKVVDVTNTTIKISWLPPAVVNGVLRRYVVKYQSTSDQNDRGEFKYEVERARADLSQNITKILGRLTSFTTYNISVVACTVTCSHVHRLHATTSLGVPAKMSKLTSSVNNMVLFEWSPPVPAGGPIVYQLLREYERDSAPHAVMYNASERERNLTMPCEADIPSSQWRIRAVVATDNMTVADSPLKGEWSDPVHVTCPGAPASVVLMYCILIIFLLMAVCLFTFYGNKAWIRCKDMRNVEVKLPPGLTTVGGGVVGDAAIWGANQHNTLCLPQHKIAKDRPITDTSHHLAHHITAADEQLLLEKKREFDSELTNLPVTQSRTLAMAMNLNMNLSNSETGSVCNSSESEISSSSPITHINLSMDDNSSSSEKDCSLRLRTFTSAPWSKAMQLKPLDGYSQIAVDGKQMQPPSAAAVSVPGSGYVSHAALAAAAQQPPPIKIPATAKQTLVQPFAPSAEALVGGGAPSAGGAPYLLPKLVPDKNQESHVKETLDDEDEEEEDEDEEDDQDDLDDEYNLSEQDSPLVDLEPSSETDDLINIEELYDSADNDVTRTTPPSATPYVSLAAAMSRSALQRPPADHSQKLPSIVDNSQSLVRGSLAEGPVPSLPMSPTHATNKPSTPNPYSRIGIWDNTPVTSPNWLTAAPVSASAPCNQPQGGVVDNKEFVFPQSSPAPADGGAATPANIDLGVDKSQASGDAGQPRPTTTSKSTSGYVPHRQFDCKLLKED